MARYCFLFLMVIMFSKAYSQFYRTEFDSVGIRKPKKAKLLYEVEHPLFQEISVKFSDPRVDKKAKGSFGGYLGRNFAASILGSWSSSQETELVIPCQLKTEPDGYGWNIDIYLNGQLEKNTERVRNSDGSRSTNTTKTIHMQWKDGAWGNIIDRVDTIGSFLLTLEPLQDSTLIEAFRNMKGSEVTKEEMKKMLRDLMIYPTSRDFGLFGNFKESAFTVLYSRFTGGGYIFLNGRLDAVIFTDNEAPGINMFTSPPKRIPPKLLIRTGVTDNQRSDMIRMALVCKLFSEMTAVDAREY